MNLVFKSKKLGNILLILTAVSFLWFGTFGLFYHMSEMGHGGSMGGCLFNGGLELCSMNLPEHMVLWQGLTSGLPQLGFSYILMLLAISALLATFLRYRLWEFPGRILFWLRLYLKQHPQISLFNYLREVFSGGILNPKIYAMAII